MCQRSKQPLLHQPQFHPVDPIQHQPMYNSSLYSHNHQCSPAYYLPEILHAHQPTITQLMACLHPLAGRHTGGRLHVLGHCNQMLHSVD